GAWKGGPEGLGGLKDLPGFDWLAFNEAYAIRVADNATFALATGGENFDVTDAWLAAIGGLSQLQTLQIINESGITEAGLAHLAALTNLETLDLRVVGKLSEVGTSHLGKIKNLRRLSISTPVDDAALGPLASMKTLEYLDVTGKEITDAG